MTTMLSTLLSRLADAFAGDRSTLRGLDARTLHDIGVDASEIDSIEAEWLGHAETTRLRIAGGGLRHA